MDFSHHASMKALGSSRTPNLRWGMLSGYSLLTYCDVGGTAGGDVWRWAGPKPV